MIRHIDAPGVIDAGSEMYGTAPMRLRRTPHPPNANL